MATQPSEPGLLSQLGATAKSIAEKTKELASKGAKEIEKRTGKEATSCDLAYALEIRLAQDVAEALKGNDFAKAKMILADAEKVEGLRKELGCH